MVYGVLYGLPHGLAHQTPCHSHFGFHRGAGSCPVRCLQAKQKVQPQVQTTVVAVLLFSLRSWRKAQGELGTSWENMGKNMGQSWEDGELQTEKN